MRRFLVIFCFAAWPMLAQAWNAAGHRLSASIAWQQLSPASRQQIGELLAAHPDYPRWAEQAESTDPGAIFAEASTWPDEIRHDPRFYDEKREPPTPPIAGLVDQARYKSWHYVDLDERGRRQAGELDRQIDRLAGTLRTANDKAQRVWALPWLLHLVGDIHQPLHVGQTGDEGGNRVTIENPYNPRRPFSSLHAYWDDLPGPGGLRRQRLAARTDDLLARYPAPVQGSVRRWRTESHALLAKAYPAPNDASQLVISEEFHRQAGEIAGQRIVAAGYRLGRLLENIFARRVSRETR